MLLNESLSNSQLWKESFFLEAQWTAIPNCLLVLSLIIHIICTSTPLPTNGEITRNYAHTCTCMHHKCHMLCHSLSPSHSTKHNGLSSMSLLFNTVQPTCLHLVFPLCSFLLDPRSHFLTTPHCTGTLGASPVSTCMGHGSVRQGEKQSNNSVTS